MTLSKTEILSVNLKLQSVAQIVGFLDLALHQKLAFHSGHAHLEDDNPFAFAIRDLEKSE